MFENTSNLPQSSFDFLSFMIRQCSHAKVLLKSEMFIFSGLALSRPSNSEKLTRFKIAADSLMTFAGEFFTKEIERQSCYNAVPVEVIFASTGCDSDKCDLPQENVQQG